MDHSLRMGSVRLSLEVSLQMKRWRAWTIGSRSICSISSYFCLKRPFSVVIYLCIFVYICCFYRFLDQGYNRFCWFFLLWFHFRSLRYGFFLVHSLYMDNLLIKTSYFRSILLTIRTNCNKVFNKCLLSHIGFAIFSHSKFFKQIYEIVFLVWILFNLSYI